jgi:hypothetical protein
LPFCFDPLSARQCGIHKATLLCSGACAGGDNGIWVKLSATNPANPIRNIRVVPAEFEHVEERQVFHPWFLKALERFKVGDVFVQGPGACGRGLTFDV